MGYSEKQISTKIMHKGPIVTVRGDIAQLDNGKQVRREVVEHPGGVGILPVDEHGDAYMVRQFRYPMMEELLEIPAGKLEYGEDHRDCAVRELGEETGFTAENFVYLGATYPSPGYCKETLHIYLATGLTAGNMHLDEDEFLNVEKYPLDELVSMVMRNELKDGKSVIAILMAKRYLDSQSK